MSKQQELINASRNRLSALEARLAKALRPIVPSRKFVHYLREHIHIPEPRLLAKRLSDGQFILIVVGAIASVGVLIVTIVRALSHFFRRKGRGSVA